MNSFRVVSSDMLTFALPNRTAHRHRVLGRRAAVVAAFASALLILAGCSAGSGSSSHGAGPADFASGGTFTLGIPLSLPSGNPYALNSGSGFMQFYNYLAYDSLVSQKTSGAFVSGLAKKWQTTSKSTTFVLRPGITCSDGAELTASQVASDLNWVGKPKNQYANLGIYTPSVPYTATADNATATVTVTTTSPFPFLLQTLGNVPIVCAKGMADQSVLTAHSDGTGPFVLKSKNQTTYTYTVRKDYRWGPDGASTSAPGTPSKVVLQTVTNPTTAASQLLAGQLTAAAVKGSDTQRLTGAGLPKASVEQSASGLTFNERAGQPTADQKVRQALAAALNFSDLVKAQTQISGSPSTRATGLRAGAPLSCNGANAESALPASSVSTAKQLLDEDGWTVGNGGVRSKDGKQLSITLAYQTATGAPMAELIQHQWQGIGVHVKLQLLTDQIRAGLVQGAVPFTALIGANALTLPSELQPEFTGPSYPKGQNLFLVDNPTYDRLAGQATAATGQDGCALWAQAENSLMQRADSVPIANTADLLFTSKSAQAQQNTLRQPIPTSLKLLK